jgi:hypothetical protein
VGRPIIIIAVVLVYTTNFNLSSIVLQLHREAAPLSISDRAKLDEFEFCVWKAASHVTMRQKCSIERQEESLNAHIQSNRKVVTSSI